MKTLLLGVIAIGVTILAAPTITSFINGWQVESQASEIRQGEIAKCQKEPDPRWRDACMALWGPHKQLTAKDVLGQ